MFTIKSDKPLKSFKGDFSEEIPTIIELSEEETSLVGGGPEVENDGRDVS